MNAIPLDRKGEKCARWLRRFVPGDAGGRGAGPAGNWQGSLGDDPG